MAENDNDNKYATIIVDGDVWAVTTSSSEDDAMAETLDLVAPSEPEDLSSPETAAAMSEQTLSQGASQENSVVAIVTGDPNQATSEPDFDALKAITKLLVGGVIEGSSQLTSRLREYEAALREEGEGEATEPVSEDELDRLRYAFVGLIFDAQATLRRNVVLWAKIADQSARATNRVTQPVTDSFLFKPLRRRFDRLANRGEDSLARWIADGRRQEQPSRDLARRTYTEVLDEFIDRLAENPELQDLITQQSIGVASEVRDEVRERTVTGDSLVEGLVRRILRRSPRKELPGPPPQVQRWAGLTLEEYRAQMDADDGTDESP